MDLQLLSIKLSIPPARPDLIPRPRLMGMLLDAQSRRLVLVSAPPGYGKTSLVAGWLREMGGSSTPQQTFAWLALDEMDNDPFIFFSYLAAAAQNLAPRQTIHLQSLLSLPQLPPAQTLMSYLLQDLKALSCPAFLVLEDYHVIHNPGIHQALSFLLEHMPLDLHLVLITREDPPLSLPRMRVRNEIVEIREVDLRLNQAEAAAFLSQTMHLALSDEVQTRLFDRTEGWIAGMQLAALALQARARTEDDQGIEAFITSFHGDDRFVMDYLMEEVFRHQPEEIQGFLLKTSILEQFCADLCEAVLRDASMSDEEPISSSSLVTHHSSQILERLEQANLFLIALDHHREWFRYHHLFAELLRYRLKREYPEQFPVYHRRAARWYSQSGNPDEAMRHAAAAADVDLAAEIAGKYGMRMIGAGRIAAYLGWIQRIPDPVIFTHPLLSACCGWAYILTGQADAAERYVQAGEDCLHRGEPATNLDEQNAIGTQGRIVQQLAALGVTEQEVRGHLAAIRSYINRRRGDTQAAIKQAQLALSLLPVQSRSARCAAALNLGLVYLDQMQYKLAREAFLQSIEAASSSGENTYAAVTALSLLGDICARSGRLHEAEGFFVRAIYHGQEGSSSEPFSPAHGVIHGWLVWLHYQRYEIPEAQKHLDIVMQAAEQLGSGETLVRAFIYQALLKQSIGEFDSAAIWLERAEERIPVSGMPDPLQTEWLKAKVHHLLLQGKVQDAVTLFESLDIRAADLEHIHLAEKPNSRLAVELPRHLMLAYVLAVQGQALLAIRLLQKIAALAEALPDMAVHLEALALLSVLQPKDLSSLQKALNLAAPENDMMPFLYSGGALIQPLLQAIAQNIQPAFAHRLHTVLVEQQHWMASLSRSVPGFFISVRYPGASQAAPDLVETLTEREKQVLRLLAAGLSSTDIASELVISVSTARSYIKNIYAKLDAHNRAEAIDRAAGLGIL